MHEPAVFNEVQARDRDPWPPTRSATAPGFLLMTPLTGVIGDRPADSSTRQGQSERARGASGPTVRRQGRASPCLCRLVGQILPGGELRFLASLTARCWRGRPCTARAETVKRRREGAAASPYVSLNSRESAGFTDSRLRSRFTVAPQDPPDVGRGGLDNRRRMVQRRSHQLCLMTISTSPDGRHRRLELRPRAHPITGSGDGCRQAVEARCRKYGAGCPEYDAEQAVQALPWRGLRHPQNGASKVRDPNPFVSAPLDLMLAGRRSRGCGKHQIWRPARLASHPVAWAPERQIQARQAQLWGGLAAGEDPRGRLAAAEACAEYDAVKLRLQAAQRGQRARRHSHSHFAIKGARGLRSVVILTGIPTGAGPKYLKMPIRVLRSQGFSFERAIPRFCEKFKNIKYLQKIESAKRGQRLGFPCSAEF
jgi:hypothetical protein